MMLRTWFFRIGLAAAVFLCCIGMVPKNDATTVAQQNKDFLSAYPLLTGSIEAAMQNDDNSGRTLRLFCDPQLQDNDLRNYVAWRQGRFIPIGFDDQDTSEDAVFVLVSKKSDPRSVRDAWFAAARLFAYVRQVPVSCVSFVWSDETKSLTELAQLFDSELKRNMAARNLGQDNERSFFASGDSASLLLHAQSPADVLVFLHPEPTFEKVPLSQLKLPVLKPDGNIYSLYSTGDVGGSIQTIFVQKERKIGVWAREDKRVKFVRILRDGLDEAASDTSFNEDIMRNLPGIFFATLAYEPNRDFDMNILTGIKPDLRTYPLCVLRDKTGVLNTLPSALEPVVRDWDGKNDQAFTQHYHRSIHDKATGAQKLLGHAVTSAASSAAATAGSYASTAAGAASSLWSGAASWWAGSTPQYAQQQASEPEVGPEQADAGIDDLLSGWEILEIDLSGLNDEQKVFYGYLRKAIELGKDEFKRYYKKESLAVHPDKNKGDDTKFKQLAAVYELTQNSLQEFEKAQDNKKLEPEQIRDTLVTLRSKLFPGR